MSNVLSLTVTYGHKEEKGMMNGEVVKFDYLEVVVDNYRYRERVENHNASRHYGGTKPQIGSKSVWGATWWPIRVFAFSHRIHWNEFISGDEIFPQDRWYFYEFWKNRLRRWLTTHIWMRRHAEVHKIPERDKYRTYWRLHMLLNTKERVFTTKYKYQQYRSLGNNYCVNFVIVVSRLSDVRSTIQEHHTNGNLISFCVMLFDFFLLLYMDDIIILLLKD